MDDVTSQRAQQPMAARYDGGVSPMFHDPSQRSKSPTPLGLCGNVYVTGRVSPYGSFGAPETLEEGHAGSYLQNNSEMTVQNDLDLEILLRGNLLQQQQQRITILETSLSSMCNEIQKYRAQLQDMDCEKGALAKPQPKVQSRYWTAEEHHQFLVGLEKYGPRDVKSIAALVTTRNATQVRTHAQKYFLRVARETGEDDPDATEEQKTNTRKRMMMSESMVDCRDRTDASESPELLPQEPQEDDDEGDDFGAAGFGSVMGYELGDFGASLDIQGTQHPALGGDSPLRAFDEDLAMSKGPMRKRMKESFERNSRSVSPSRLDGLGDLEEVNADEVVGIYEHSQVSVKD